MAKLFKNTCNNLSASVELLLCDLEDLADSVEGDLDHDLTVLFDDSCKALTKLKNSLKERGKPAERGKK
jgi:hypothetical protein